MTDAILIPTTTEGAARRLKKLAHLIAHHDDLYYNQATPEITDAEYDRLRRENAAIEEAFPALIRADSPTHRDRRSPVGCVPKSGACSADDLVSGRVQRG